MFVVLKSASDTPVNKIVPAKCKFFIIYSLFKYYYIHLFGIAYFYYTQVNKNNIYTIRMHAQ